MANRTQDPGPHEHFTISYAGFNRPWATWIARQLEELGHETTLLVWDPPSGMSISDALRDLLRSPGRVLLVLDDRSFSLGPRADTDWAQVLHEVVPPRGGRLSAVSVATQALPAAAPLRPIGLRDLDAREARHRILRRLDLDATTVPGPVSGSAPRFPNDPPAVWNMPRRNAHFTGRDTLLDKLHARLEEGGRGGARVALRGISGVGKSQIAIEYAHLYSNDYNLVWWVGAGFRAPAREQFEQLAAKLDLPVGPTLGERIRAVQEALRKGEPYRRWLLVLDNADDMEQIEDLLPGGNGHVLITTLTQDWAASGSATEIEVEPFQRPESVACARRRAQRLTEAEADELADAVRDLPLLLAQTAAWLDANVMPAKDYVAMIRRGEASRLGIRISSDYPMGFQTSWSITLNTLREDNPEAVELLYLFALFSPDAIPVRLMRGAHTSDLPARLAPLVADPIRWHTALHRLSESTAIRWDYVESSEPGPAVHRVSMHHLYHGFLLSTLAEDHRDSLSKIACALLAGADPRRPSDIRDWPRYAELIPHLETAGAPANRNPVVRQLVLNCVEYMRIRGEYQAALRLCEQAIVHWRTWLRPDEQDMLVLVHQYANMLRRIGRYQEAQTVGRAVLDRLAEARTVDDPDLLRAKNGLAGTLSALGRYDEARAMFQEYVDAHSDALGAEAPPTLQGRSNLAWVAGLQGRYEESLLLHRDILLIRERLLGPRHHLALRSAMFCSWMLRLLGRYGEAISLQEFNVRAHQQTMDPFTPQTLFAEHNLALCMRRAGDLPGAESLMRSVVERFVQRQGPHDPDALLVQADFATLSREHGDRERAREMAATVAEGYADLVGPQHPYAIGTMGNLGLALWEYGEREEALRIAEQTLTRMRAAVGPTHPWTLGAALNASGARSLAGDAEGAAELSRAVLKLARHSMGETHPLTLSCKAAFAGDLHTLRHVQNPATLSVRHRERPLWDFEPQMI
ncbi:FxSxx-COOH system tetratricopeptide repeat protein [Streptomyces prunicolor]|uniref:FxSxx-COOH system tetratricopeptide repeat protein n=1 Tax=Streptomyces prunicolor TaxID=67348 RepID=UPI003427023E